MNIYDMMHKTLWINVAAELLVKGNLSVSLYKNRFFSSMNLDVLNNCLLCNEFSACPKCLLYSVDFACFEGWYHDLIGGRCDLATGFYYAIRCAYIGHKENQEEWVCDGVQAVLMVLRLKLNTEEIDALETLSTFIQSLPLSHADAVFCEKVIKGRLVELKEDVK